MQNDECSHHGVDDHIHGDYPNETIRLLKHRTSCRGYLDKIIEPEVMNHLLEAAVHGPSGGNLQPFSIIKIERPETKRRIARMCQQAFIGKAPVDLLFCIDWYRLKNGRSWKLRHLWPPPLFGIFGFLFRIRSSPLRMSPPPPMRWDWVRYISAPSLIASRLCARCLICPRPYSRST